MGLVLSDEPNSVGISFLLTCTTDLGYPFLMDPTEEVSPTFSLRMKADPVSDSILTLALPSISEV
jgi:hypothetical protein